MKNQEPGPSQTDTQQYSCSQCGAKLSFAPGTLALKCPYCNFELQISKPKVQVAELDYRSYLEKAAQEKISHETQRVCCKKCGAETSVSAESTADVCPFCGAGIVFSGDASRVIKPEGLLPFKVTQKEALESFRRWIKGLWFAPGKLKQFAQADSRLPGVYIPYWTYDSETITSYIGERGEHYYTTENYVVQENGREVVRSRRVQHTRWTPASGTVGNSFDDILILASKSLPQEYADRLAPWDLAAIVPYSDEYLSGFRAEKYQVPLADGFEAAKTIMAPAIEASIRSDIGGDEQRILSTETRYSSITFKHILLPVWMSAYRFREKIFRILINARTGEVQGERPYSAWKIACAVIAGLVLVGIFIIIASSRS